MVKRCTRKNVVNKRKRGTLDQKHTEKIEKFRKQNDSLPKKKKKLKELKKKLLVLQRMNPNHYTNVEIREKSVLMESIANLENEINNIENGVESLDYIEKTLSILDDYYNNNNVVDDNINEEYFRSINQTSNKKNVLSYFFQENEKYQQNKNVLEDPETTQKISRAKLYDNYLYITEENHLRKAKKINICNNEGCNGKKIYSNDNGHLVCSECGLMEPTLISTEKPNYKEPSQDSGTYAYKRINHLTEILSQLQAKESTEIPPEVFDTISRELRKKRINKNDLDIFKLRKILKKANYRKYYEHIPHILQVINGKVPPRFSRRDEIRIKKMFRDIQEPFAIYCPKDRKNFLNYSYVLHKICELLDLDEYIDYFPLLKNNAKLRQHDRIWKQICHHMRWKYYKSL